MNRTNEYYLVMIFIIVVTILTGCEKEKKATIPILTTSTISNKTATTLTSGGNIIDDGGATITTRGVCWSSGITPTIADNKTTNGAGAGSFTSNITGMNGGSTYYVRAFASNSEGTGYGIAISFTTLGQSPLPTISTATNINGTGATFNGSVNANYLSTLITFEYGTTTSYGSTITAIQSPVTGNANTSVSANITGLTEVTIYHYRIKSVNYLGTTYSNDITFTNSGQGPVTTTRPATNVNTSGATLHGSINTTYLSTVASFEYGITTSYGGTVTATQSLINGKPGTSISVLLSALAPNTTYHFRVKLVNSLGTNYGNDLTFTTLGQSPTAITQTTSKITTSGAKVNGIVNANFLATTVTFEYGTTDSYDKSVTATHSPATGNSTISVGADVFELSPNTTCHFRIKAVNLLGTAYGDDMVFTTLGQIPTVMTTAATIIQPFSSTLNGIVNANHLESTVTFEYGTSTSYGRTATATQSPVTGGMSTTVSTGISGLTLGVTYHYRIVATNSLGTTYGNDLTFETMYQVPTP